MKIKVQVKDIGVTRSVSEECMSSADLNAWVADQEKNKRRYIVFPTVAHMMSWRANVSGMMPWRPPLR